MKFKRHQERRTIPFAKSFAFFLVIIKTLVSLVSWCFVFINDFLFLVLDIILSVVDGPGSVAKKKKILVKSFFPFHYIG